MAATTMDTISRWFDDGVKTGSQYMIVVCDVLNHEDFPVYADGPAAVIRKYREYVEGAGSMTRVMEIYDLSKDKWPQMISARAWALPDE